MNVRRRNLDMVEQKALKKVNDNSKRYLGNIADKYVFLENKSKSQQDCIGIKGGKYEGVIYKYGKIAQVEDANNGTLPATSHLKPSTPSSDNQYFISEIISLRKFSLL